MERKLYIGISENKLTKKTTKKKQQKKEIGILWETEKVKM